MSLLLLLSVKANPRFMCIDGTFSLLVSLIMKGNHLAVKHDSARIIGSKLSCDSS